MGREIRIIGCHDETIIDEEDWGKPFTKDEEDTIQKICELSQKISGWDCMPVVKFGEKKNE